MMKGVILAVLLALLAHSTAGQGLPHPMRGSIGVPAPPGLTVVLVDVVIQHFDQIHSARNAYSSLVWFHLSWKDSRAANAIQTRTREWAANPVQSGASTCARPCDAGSQDIYGGCCDTVWMPFLDLPNMSGISQESVYSEHIYVEPSSTNSAVPGDWVHWSARVTGEWRSPFDFRAWPFEHQHLLMEMQLPPSLANRAVLLLNSASFAQNTPHSKGELLPGWHRASVTGRVYDMTACYTRPGMRVVPGSVYDISNATGQVAFTPLTVDSYIPMDPLKMTVVSNVSASECGQLIPSGSDAGQVLESLSYVGPRMIVVDVMVRRSRDYYLLANIVPLIIMTYMVFVIYAMERSDLESRMGVVVALVLAVSALQFTWDFPPSNYLNCVQQLTLMSYVLYLVVALESMISSYITRLHKRRRQKREVQSLLHQAAGMSQGHVLAAAHANGAAGYVSDPASQKHAYPAGAQNLPSPVENSQSTTPTEAVYLNLPATADASVAVQPRPGVGSGTRRRPGPLAEAREDFRPVSEPGVRPGSSAGAQVDKGVMMIESPQAELPPSSSKPRAAWSRVLSSKFMSMARGTSFKKKSKKIGSKDEAWAIWVARRMDIVMCWTLLIAYTITMVVLLYVNSQVGDHKLMMHGTPANM